MDDKLTGLQDADVRGSRFTHLAAEPYYLTLCGNVVRRVLLFGAVKPLCRRCAEERRRPSSASVRVASS